ncbi:MAG: hypothetical protein ACE5FZ_03965 [Nitrospiria bacterium]
MNLGDFLKKYGEDPALLRKARKGLYVFLSLVVVSDFFILHDHVIFLWDKIPGWWSFFGFISAVVMIFLSKAIGHVWLMKREDYYD